MPVINHIPELLAWKCGGRRQIVAQNVATDAQLSYDAVIHWSKEPHFDTIEASVLEAWCSYLGVTVGQLFEYVPENRD